ncbi:MAG: ribosomal protein L7/L12 [Planctomycetes bacterium]|nr:ribosomal protein L7/L12 [Planctomycetota bacterium]
MSEEAAFLKALKANPADDTVRLVYADWLDEHNEPAKAEYLRLVAVLTHTCEESTRERPEVGRLLSLTELLPQEWRQESASRFMLVFYSHGDMTQKIPVVKLIREITGVGLAEAKKLVEEPPSKLLTCVPFEYALPCRERFEQIPGAVVRIHPTDVKQLPFSVAFAIVASRMVWGNRPDREYAALESITMFARFLHHAMGIPEEAARKLAAQDHVTIAENLELATARARVEELRRFKPLHDEMYGWSIFIATRAMGIEPVANK